MWQLTWMFNLIPDFVLSAISYLLAIGGVVAFVGSKFFPKFLVYRKAAELGGILAIAIGSYGIGWFSCNAAWTERARVLQEQVAAAQAESQAANEKLNNKGQEKVKIIREKGIIIKQYVDREVTKYDSTCVIPDTVVKAHNAAARNEAIK